MSIAPTIGPMNVAAPPTNVINRTSPDCAAPIDWVFMISKFSAARPPAMPAKRAGKRERDKPHHSRRIADEFGALGILAHRVAHAPERRARNRIHRKMQKKHQTAMR